MKAQSLINKYEWSEIEPILLKCYPDQESSIDGYAKVFAELKSLTPVESDLEFIDLNWYEDDFDNKFYMSIDGIDKKDGSWGLDFVPWNEILALKIYPNDFSELEMIVHILYEITFHGFEQETIDRKRDVVVGLKEEYFDDKN